MNERDLEAKRQQRFVHNERGMANTASPFHTEELDGTRHNNDVSDPQRYAQELISLMEEFGLGSAELSGEGWRIAFRKNYSRPPADAPMSSLPAESYSSVQAPQIQTPVPTGTPISSPMTGIYYSSPSPQSPPFVSVGDTVEAGQVVALIEAMKVFNEIVSPVSGVVTALQCESGQLVQPGEALIMVG